MKRMIFAFVLAAGGMLVPAGRAAAVQVDTPPLHIAGPGYLGTVASRCMIVNASTKDITVDTAEIVDENGSTAASATGVDVPAGVAGVLVETTAPHQAFCRVSGRFPKRRVQVYLCAEENGVCFAAVRATR